MRAEIASKSSSVSDTPASLASAIRCRTALVDPAVVATAAMAFSNAARVRILLGRRSSVTSRMTILPARTAAAFFRPSTAGMSLSPMGESPSISPAIDIVLAVNWPPQAPAPGQATSSSARSSASVIRPAAQAPTASNTSWIVTCLPLEDPGHDRPAVEHQPRHVEARQGHHRPGDRLVAARERHHAVAQRAAHRELDRIGDHLARDERGPHPLGPHADAVGDDDGVELDRASRPRARIPSFTWAAELPQVHVARRGVGPGVGHRDERLVEVGVLEPGRLQHRPRRRAVDSLEECVASSHGERLCHAAGVSRSGCRSRTDHEDDRPSTLPAVATRRQPRQPPSP